jgi:pyridoxamine--pyruvate transaminase
VTAVKMPAGMNDAELRGTMREKYGVMISGGHGDLIGKLFRIGHMGRMAQVPYVLAALAALEKTLTYLGVSVPNAAGVAAALATWDSGLQT